MIHPDDAVTGVPETRDLAATRLAHKLGEVSRLRRTAFGDPVNAQALLALKAWQSARLARTYPDLLAHPRYGEAARFFLDDLYGGRDYSQRDADLARILPKLTAMLPVPALSVIADAVELDALSEHLDVAMVLRLGQATAAGLDETTWADAYRACGNRSEREHQIRLMRHIGDALDGLTRLSLLATSLRLMRGPARLVGLEDLHSFLYRGFHAFKAMGGAAPFLDAVESRETLLMRRLFAGDANPFGGQAAEAVI